MNIDVLADISDISYPYLHFHPSQMLGNGGSSRTVAMHEGVTVSAYDWSAAGDNDATAGAVQHCTAEMEPCIGKKRRHADAVQLCNMHAVLRHVCAAGRCDVVETGRRHYGQSRCCVSLSVKSPSTQLVLGSTLVKHSTNHVQVHTIILLLSTDELYLVNR